MIKIFLFFWLSTLPVSGFSITQFAIFFFGNNSGKLVWESLGKSVSVCVWCSYDILLAVVMSDL